MADPTTGLTARDRQMIRETWEVVGNKNVIKERGVDLFIALFEAHPYMQAYFKDFKDVPVKDLKTDAKLQTHSIRTMTGLKQYVEALDDIPTLAGLITKMAKTHLPRGIKTEEMDKLAVVFIVYMKRHVGAKWTDEASAAWTQLLKVHNVVYRGEEEKLSAAE